MALRRAHVDLAIHVAEPDEPGGDFVATCERFPGVEFRASTKDGAVDAAAAGFRDLLAQELRASSATITGITEIPEN